MLQLSYTLYNKLIDLKERRIKMDVIKNYLETMFQNFPDTPEVRRAKDELLAKVEQNYYELKRQGKTENEAIGMILSEYGTIDALRNAISLQTPPADYGRAPEQEGRTLSLSELNGYMATTKKTSLMIGIGVMLCIFSVVPLILFDALPIAGQVTEAIGCIFLFVLIAVAVALFILSGMTSKKYEYLKKTTFQLDHSMEAKLRSEKDVYERTFTIHIIIGVCLCILSVLPPIIAGCLSDITAIFENGSALLFLLFVAIAVYLFITSGMKLDCYKVLLQEEEYSKERKNNKLTGIVASIYWPIVTCIYLGYSFITGNWLISWIIWPITGTLFGAIACICNLIEQSRTRR